jgi:hypothetical protein
MCVRNANIVLKVCGLTLNVRVGLVLLFFGAAFLLFCPVAFGANTPDRQYSTEDVVAGIRAAEAQFSNLRIHFTKDRPANTDADPARREVADVTFARRLPEGWLYYHATHSYFGSPASEKSKHEHPDVYAVFDGSSTVTLENQPGGMKPWWAAIYAGRRDADFPLNEIPQAWLYGMADYISKTESGVTFAVKNSDDIISGLHAVRLEREFIGGSLQKVWIVPERSFLMIRRETWFPLQDGRRRNFAYEATDLIKLDNGLWYPRSMRAGFLDEPGHFSIFKVLEISTSLLKQDFFKVNMPPHTNVTDFINNERYVTLDATTRPGATTEDVPKSENSLREYIENAQQQKAAQH